MSVLTEALERVDRNADEDWKRRADVALAELASERPRITADDLWSKVEKPREPRAAGPVFMRAKSKGLIAHGGRVVPSRFTSQHHGDVKVWKSLDPKWSSYVDPDEVDMGIIERTANALYKQGNRRAAGEIRKLVSLTA